MKKSVLSLLSIFFLYIGIGITINSCEHSKFLLCETSLRLAAEQAERSSTSYYYWSNHDNKEKMNHFRNEAKRAIIKIGNADSTSFSTIEWSWIQNAKRVLAEKEI